MQVPAAIADAAKAEREAKLHKEERRFFGYVSRSVCLCVCCYFLACKRFAVPCKPSCHYLPVYPFHALPSLFVCMRV